MRFMCIPLLFGLMLAPAALAQEKKKLSAQEIEKLVQTWETKVRTSVAKDEKLKTLAAKYPLVLLHTLNQPAGSEGPDGYSFIYETKDRKSHGNKNDLLFINGVDIDENGKQERINFLRFAGPDLLAVHLGKVDFQKDLDPKKISITHPGIIAGHADSPEEGDVYLQRVWDVNGNDFFVLLQIVALDREGRYMAFVWRALPGGKRVRYAICLEIQEFQHVTDF